MAAAVPCRPGTGRRPIGPIRSGQAAGHRARAEDREHVVREPGERATRGREARVVEVHRRDDPERPQGRAVPSPFHGRPLDGRPPRRRATVRRDCRSSRLGPRRVEQSGKATFALEPQRRHALAVLGREEPLAVDGLCRIGRRSGRSAGFRASRDSWPAARPGTPGDRDPGAGPAVSPPGVAPGAEAAYCRSTTRYISPAAISRSARYDTRSASPAGTRCVHSNSPPA